MGVWAKLWARFARRDVWDSIEVDAFGELPEPRHFYSAWSELARRGFFENDPAEARFRVSPATYQRLRFTANRLFTGSMFGLVVLPTPGIKTGNVVLEFRRG